MITAMATKLTKAVKMSAQKQQIGRYRPHLHAATWASINTISSGNVLHQTLSHSVNSGQLKVSRELAQGRRTRSILLVMAAQPAPGERHHKRVSQF